MDPNANPQAPTGPTPDQQVSQNGAADQTPAPQTPLPDWQQGLTTDSQQAPTPMGAQTMPPTPGVGPDSGVGMSTQPVAPQTPTMSPQPTSPVMGMASPSQKKKMPMMIIIIGLVVVIALAVGAYFLFGNNNKSANNAARQSERTASSSAIDLTTLSGATLNPPADLSGYKANSATTAGQYIYETSASTNTNVCQLQLGIYTPAQLPGTDLNDIVKKGLTSLTSATISGPSAGPALILKDSAKSSVTYSLPTLEYQLTEGAKHATFVLSIAIMKDGNRAFVGRECANVSGAVDQSGLQTVENTAKSVTVTKP